MKKYEVMMGVANLEMFVECLSKTVIFVQKIYDFQIRLPKNTFETMT